MKTDPAAGGDFRRGLDDPPPDSVEVAGRVVLRGSRVRVLPREGDDVLDLALSGREGRVEGIDHDPEGELYLAVVFDEDTGRHLDGPHFPGHRFFFTLGEVEPLDSEEAAPPRRLLVAGVGNGVPSDDAFGPQVARELARRRRLAGVDVVDLGICGLDLAHALQNSYDGILLLDALPGTQEAGTLVVFEPQPEPSGEVRPESRAMDPAQVLAFARQLVAVPEQALVVACVSARLPAAGEGDVPVTDPSAPVRGAVSRAAELVEALAEEFLATGRFRHPPAESLSR